MPDICLSDIKKDYYINKDKVTNVLVGINLKIKQGSLVAIKGPSGAGKSTLLHIIGCNDKPTSGQYLLENTNIATAPQGVLAQLRNKVFGFVLQDFGLIENETVLNNVYLPLMFRKGKIKDMKQKALDILKQFNMEAFTNRYVMELSGGEKQRVAIARAIINDPDIILADEPTGSLDSENSAIIMNILIKLNQQGKTVIIITHDDDIASFCSNVLTVKDGAISNSV